MNEEEELEILTRKKFPSFSYLNMKSQINPDADSPKAPLIKHSNSHFTTYTKPKTKLKLRSFSHSHFYCKYVLSLNKFNVKPKNGFITRPKSNPTLNELDEKDNELIKLENITNECKLVDEQLEIALNGNFIEKSFPLIRKTSDDLRKIYLTKLMHKNIWFPTKQKKKFNTLIIFDWDDTLLPTSFLTPGGVFNDSLVLSKKDEEQMKLIEMAVLKVLTISLEKGNTFIITNAAPGWVEYTATKFYPSIIKILQKIKVLSARGGYEKLYPKDYRQWKIQTFLEMKKEFDSFLVTNIICLGDSLIEMEAAHLLSSKFNKSFIKTIKFRESPKLKVFHKQLLMVIEKFPEIYITLKSMAISIDKKVGKI